MWTPSRPGLSTRRCSWSRARTRRALSLISSRIRTLPSALPSSRSSLAPSQPEDTFGHIWTHLDTFGHNWTLPSAPRQGWCLWCSGALAVRQGAPLRLPGHTPQGHSARPWCSARGAQRKVCLVWRHGRDGGRLCVAEKGTAAGPLAIACSADPIPYIACSADPIS